MKILFIYLGRRDGLGGSLECIGIIFPNVNLEKYPDILVLRDRAGLLQICLSASYVHLEQQLKIGHKPNSNDALKTHEAMPRSIPFAGATAEQLEIDPAESVQKSHGIK